MERYLTVRFVFGAVAGNTLLHGSARHGNGSVLYCENVWLKRLW